MVVGIRRPLRGRRNPHPERWATIMKSPVIETCLKSDIPRYVELATDAQAFLQSIGLSQWVPAAHSAYTPEIERKVCSREVYTLREFGKSIGYFCFTEKPPEWWCLYPTAAGYVSGIVVARTHKGRNLGRKILDWCERRTADAGHSYLRLDCHAQSTRLREFYRSFGFTEVTIVEQHPGYFGVLMEKLVTHEKHD